MGTWKSRGLRGSTLEDMINHTNEIYREKKLALIQKIPTPSLPSPSKSPPAISPWPTLIRKVQWTISVPYRVSRLCFDAKECAVKTFPLQNVHEHQIQFMKEFEEQGGIAFIILHFTALDEMYYMPFRDLEKFWKRMETGGRKSFTYDEIDKTYQIRASRDILVHYLETIQKDLTERDTAQ